MRQLLLCILLYRFWFRLRLRIGLRAILCIPGGNFFVRDRTGYAEQCRRREYARGDLEIVRAQICAADRRGKDRRDPRDRRQDQELDEICIRASDKISHGILWRTGNQIKDEQQAVALLPILQKPHGPQLFFQMEQPKDTHAQFARHEQNDDGTDDVARKAKRQSAKRTP